MAKTEALIVDHRRLEKLAASMFAAHDVPEADAGRIATCLVLADLRGLPSHGIARLPVYAERMRKGW